MDGWTICFLVLAYACGAALALGFSKRLRFAPPPESGVGFLFIIFWPLILAVAFFLMLLRWLHDIAEGNP